MRKSKNPAKRIAVSAVSSAMICVILALSTVFETLDLTFATISSLIIWIVLLEFGKATAWGIYFASSVISLLFLPSKFPALFFCLVTGWYPMFKFFLDKKLKNKKIRLIIKLAVFNLVTAVLTASVYFFGSVIGLTFSEEITKLYIAAMLIMCNIAFIITDILMDKLVVVYIVKIRNKLIQLKIIDK